MAVHRDEGALISQYPVQTAQISKNGPAIRAGEVKDPSSQVLELIVIISRRGCVHRNVEQNAVAIHVPENIHHELFGATYP